MGSRRTTQYKEDSTRGLSKMVPKTYKGDAYVQSWLDSRKLATLSKWLDESSDYRTRFLADIVRLAVDMVVEHLVSVGEVKMIEFTEDARSMLDRKYRVNLNPCDRGKKNVLHNMLLDEKRRKSGSVIVQRDLGQAQDQVQTSDVDWEKIQEKIKAEEEKEAREKLKESMDRIKGAGQIDEDGVITPMGKSSSVVYQEDMDAYEKREEDRVSAEEDEKELKTIGSAQEKLREKLYLMEAEEHEKSKGKNGRTGEGVPEGSDSNSGGVEEEGTNAGTDSP